MKYIVSYLTGLSIVILSLMIGNLLVSTIVASIGSFIAGYPIGCVLSNLIKNKPWSD